MLIDGLLAIIAGADTTASTLSHVFFRLLSNPETYKRLQAEVDQYYPPGENALDPTHYVRMSYLDAVMQVHIFIFPAGLSPWLHTDTAGFGRYESMRLLPAVQSGSMRAPPRGSGGKTFGNQCVQFDPLRLFWSKNPRTPSYSFIPERTQVRVSIRGVHRDPRNFSDPTAFKPERWLIAQGTLPAPAGEPFVHNADAFIPFSFGPANCAGKNLAMMEMRMVLCLCMQKLQMRFADGWDPQRWHQNVEDYFVAAVGELPVVVVPRD